MPERILLGDEAVAQAAADAGLTAAYAYPGTPSTEILEYLLERSGAEGAPHAAWCANEKTAYEAALGVCFAGRRAMVSMKHVGLNVAADPFVNSALVGTHGGLVVAVADDPGMHSSQNEQDSRWYAEFARVPCLEPSSPQEAYDMTREAFDLSERFAVPVLLRLVTRLAHCRAVVRTSAPRPQNVARKAPAASSWVLLPANARRQWNALLARQGELRATIEASPWNALVPGDESSGRVVITTGLARSYYAEVAPELPRPLPHLHLGSYPIPEALLGRLVERARRVLVLEDGYPYVERLLRGLIPGRLAIEGRMSGEVPAAGELSPEVVRAALGLPALPLVTSAGPPLPPRPPQLCQGCPHGFAYSALKEALGGNGSGAVTSDIGCYTLGALPPISAIESCVCMGASIGMARGAADAGFRRVVAVIGDGTFLHSGITPLVDAAAADTPMTLLILDNQATAMTGVQDPLVPSSRLQAIVLGCGVDPEHLAVMDAHPRKVHEMAKRLRAELDHPGLSVVIAVRECKVAAQQRSRRAGAVA